MVLAGSDVIGRQVTGVKLFKREGVRLMDVLRGDLSLRRDLPLVMLEAGERVVLRSQICLLTSLLTELVNNRAVVVVVEADYDQPR